MNLPVNASPFEYCLDPDQAALIVIDMQRDFIEHGGFGESLGNDVTRLQAILPAVTRLLEVCRQVGMLIVHTREGHQSDLSDCPPAKRERGSPTLRIGDEGPMGRLLVIGSHGHGIVPEAMPEDGELIIDKPGKGAFYATALDAHLKARGITHLLFAGVTTEVCVQTTMREANDRGYQCLLIEDATESYFAEFKRATLDMIRAQGAIVGWTAPLAALEDALQKHR
jgi:nicotinamidase-related amidase